MKLADPDQALQNAASDLGLHCLPMSQMYQSWLYIALCRHSDKNSVAINNRSRLTRGLIMLVNDNQVDNYHKKILAFVYYGSIVNNDNAWYAAIHD